MKTFIDNWLFIILGLSFYAWVGVRTGRILGEALYPEDKDGGKK